MLGFRQNIAQACFARAAAPSSIFSTLENDALGERAGAESLVVMKNNRSTIHKVEGMKARLRELRRLALEASRKGDSAEAARLSAEAIRLNRVILEAEGMSNFA